METALGLGDAAAWPPTTHGRDEIAATDPPPVGEATLDPEAVARLAREVRSGTYRPRVDEVAELLVAWLFLESSARTN